MAKASIKVTVEPDLDEFEAKLRERLDVVLDEYSDRLAEAALPRQVIHQTISALIPDVGHLPGMHLSPHAGQ